MDVLEIMRQILNKLTTIESDISELKQGQAEIIKRLDSLEARVDRLEARLDSLEARLDSLEARVNRIEAQQAIDSESIDFISVEVGKLVMNQKTHGKEIDRLKASS